MAGFFDDLFGGTDLGGLIGGIGSIIGGVENANSMEGIQDLLAKAMEDAKKARTEQLGLARGLYDERVNGDVATQKDLQQFDTGFAQPAINRFAPAYDESLSRFMEGDQYSPETLRSALMSKAESGIADAYDKVTNATAMQALRTGTNAAETMKELAKQRSEDTRRAFTDAELAALTGSQDMNLKNRQASRSDLDTTQGPLADALGKRTAGAAGLFGGSQKGRDVATSGLMANLSSAFGNQQNANTQLAPTLATAMSGSDPWSTMLGGLGNGLQGIFGNKKPADTKTEQIGYGGTNRYFA